MRSAQPAPPPGKRASFALAVAVHLLLAAFLIYGIHWQNRVSSQAVRVQLVQSLPEPHVQPRPRPKPKVRHKVEPKVTPKPPPKVETKPPPPPPPKPEILRKAKPKPKPVEKPKPKPVPKPPPKPKPKPKPVPKPKPKPLYDPFQQQLEQELKQTNERKAQEIMNQAMNQELAKLNTAAMSRALKAWQDKIAAKIRGNIVKPVGISGNPEAVFEVHLLPDGSLVGKPVLRKSTGIPALDDAIERAIEKSSPLPKPNDPSVFERTLMLTFRPLENP